MEEGGGALSLVAQQEAPDLEVDGPDAWLEGLGGDALEQPRQGRVGGARLPGLQSHQGSVGAARLPAGQGGGDAPPDVAQG